MPTETLQQPPLIIPSFGGIDESFQETEPNQFLVAARGVKTFRDGELQRILGKKLIESKPSEAIYGLHQVWNSFGQSALLEQSSTKLYFNTAKMPVVVQTSFSLPSSLGTDGSGNTLDVWTAAAPPTPSPDTTISPVFGFSGGPATPSQAHPGVDYIVISVNPLSASDKGLSTRLQSLNTGTPYDGYDVGFYFTENACRFDSIPVDTIGLYEIPPIGSLQDFLAWGGSALIPGWKQIGSSSDGYLQWLFNTNVDTTSTTFATSDIGKLAYVYNSTKNYYILTGIDGSNHAQWTKLLRSNLTWEWAAAANRTGQAVVSGDIGKYGIQYDTGQVYQLTNIVSGNGVWGTVNGPQALLETWSYLDQTTRTTASGFVSGDKGKIAYQISDNTYWVLINNSPATWTQLYPTTGIKIPSLTYATDFLRIHANVSSSDINKVAYVASSGTFWFLASTQVHSSSSDRSESYLINLVRLFQDYQSIQPASIQFLLKAYWLNARGGAGQFTLTVTTYLGGTPSKTDTITIQVTGGAQQATSSTTQTSTQLTYGDAKGTNVALITITLANGVINISTPPANTDFAQLCPF